MRLDSLIDALCDVLQQELTLLTALSPEQYRASPEGHFKSSVGKHLRHNLDHFEAFFVGLELGRIDYETRGRKSQIEDSPEVASDTLKNSISQLKALRGSADGSVEVREESQAGTFTRRWLSSSIGRELQFLLGHSVHHNAIIAMIVDRHGLPLPAGFGIAPSTQRHQAQTQAVSF